VDAERNALREVLLNEKTVSTVPKLSLASWVHGITCLDNGLVVACAYVDSLLALYSHQPEVSFVPLFYCIRPVAVCTTSSGNLAWLTEQGKLFLTRHMSCLNEMTPSSKQKSTLLGLPSLFSNDFLQTDSFPPYQKNSSPSSQTIEFADDVTMFINKQLLNSASDVPLLRVNNHLLIGPLSPFAKEMSTSSQISTVFDGVATYRVQLMMWISMLAVRPLDIPPGLNAPLQRLQMNIKVHLPEMNILSPSLQKSNYDFVYGLPTSTFSFTDSLTPGWRLLVYGSYIFELSAQQELTMVYNHSNGMINCVKKVQDALLFCSQYSIYSLDFNARTSTLYAGVDAGHVDGHRLTHARFQGIHQFVEAKGKLFISEATSGLRILDLASGMVSSIKCIFDIGDWQMANVPLTKVPQELVQRWPFQPCYLGLSPSEHVLYVGDLPYGGQIRLFHTKSGALSDPIAPGVVGLSSPVGIGNGLILALHPLSCKASLINSIAGSHKDYLALDASYLSMELGESELVLASPRAISVMPSSNLGLNLNRYIHPSEDTGPDWQFLKKRIQSLDVRTRVSLAVSGFFTKAPIQFFRALNLCNDKNVLTEQDRYEIPTLIRLLFAWESTSSWIGLRDLLRCAEFEGYYLRGFYLCHIHEDIGPYYLDCYMPYCEAESPAFETRANRCNLQYLSPSDMPSYDTKLRELYELTLPQAIKAIGQNLKLRPRYNTALYSSFTPLPPSLPTFPAPGNSYAIFSDTACSARVAKPWLTISSLWIL
jgi:hypothetical protein